MDDVFYGEPFIRPHQQTEEYGTDERGGGGKERRTGISPL